MDLRVRNFLKKGLILKSKRPILTYLIKETFCTPTITNQADVRKRKVVELKG